MRADSLVPALSLSVHLEREREDSRFKGKGLIPGQRKMSYFFIRSTPQMLLNGVNFIRQWSELWTNEGVLSGGERAKKYVFNLSFYGVTVI